MRRHCKVMSMEVVHPKERATGYCNIPINPDTKHITAYTMVSGFSCIPAKRQAFGWSNVLLEGKGGGPREIESESKSEREHDSERERERETEAKEDKKKKKKKKRRRREEEEKKKKKKKRYIYRFGHSASSSGLSGDNDSP